MSKRLENKNIVVTAAGANAFVAGSAVFNDKQSVAENVRLLRDKIAPTFLPYLLKIGRAHV